jgi:hypothetical protein
MLKICCAVCRYGGCGGRVQCIVDLGTQLHTEAILFHRKKFMLSIELESGWVLTPF